MRADTKVAAIGRHGAPALRLWLADRGRPDGLICGRLNAANPLVVHETGRAFLDDDRAGNLRLEPSPQTTGAIAFKALWAERCAQGDR